ncbi:MAG: hypothetical protein EPN46_03320 [Candidimonas sp.]|nr:MAG: hypothetical protein EPN77_08670 [Candidimonas sp.]TAM22415.1 MAG: hypothetical protein EPN62_12005 [Candidimonas sp.]TAM79447.1 MAG: hypothetical protein EPN46_03320 [Candidimonas sp.]
MANRSKSIQDIYTRKVGGETFQYDLTYMPGATVEWNARVYQNGDLKGTPSGSVSHNVMTGKALAQFLISYVEGVIERGIGIDE